MKARGFGGDRLDYWDRNAPLPDADDRTLRWDEARDTVLSAYGDFDPEMAEVGGRFFERNWIDAPAHPGKSPGAFAHPTVPSGRPEERGVGKGGFSPCGTWWSPNIKKKKKK